MVFIYGWLLDKSNVFALYDLHEPPRAGMSDLDEFRVEKEDVLVESRTRVKMLWDGMNWVKDSQVVG